MRRSILTILFLSLFVEAFAQEISWNVKAGLNVSYLTEDGMRVKAGPRAGIGMECTFDKIWSFQPSLLFSMKGARASNFLPRIPVILTCNQMYMELPLMTAARFRIARSTNIILSAGPYLAYGVGGKVTAKFLLNDQEGKLQFNTFGDIDTMTLQVNGETQEIPVEEMYEYVSDINWQDMKGLKRLDYGVGVGIAVEFHQFILGVEGQLGLVKVSMEGPKNQNLSVSVGYKF